MWSKIEFSTSVKTITCLKMTIVSPFVRQKRVMRDDIIKVLRDKINDWKIIKDFIASMT